MANLQQRLEKWIAERDRIHAEQIPLQKALKRANRNIANVRFLINQSK